MSALLGGRVQLVDMRRAKGEVIRVARTCTNLGYAYTAIEGVTAAHVDIADQVQLPITVQPGYLLERLSHAEACSASLLIILKPARVCLYMLQSIYP